MPMTYGDAWVQVFGADPRSWLLTSGEAPARWVTLTALLGRPDTDDDVRSARQASVDGAMVTALFDGLPTWGGDGGVSGHDSPAYLPNMLGFLAELGVRAGDDDRIDAALDDLCATSTTMAGSRRSGGHRAMRARCGRRCRVTPT